MSGANANFLAGVVAATPANRRGVAHASLRPKKSRTDRPTYDGTKDIERRPKSSIPTANYRGTVLLQQLLPCWVLEWPTAVLLLHQY